MHFHLQVVQTIRRNKQLEKDLNTMDIKIGLLVKNQIALQEVVAHGHKLRRSVNKRIDAHDAATSSASSAPSASSNRLGYPSPSFKKNHQSIIFIE